MKYLIYCIEKNGELNVGGVYDNHKEAQARFDYIVANFTWGEWQIERIPDMDIKLGSVLLLNKKD